MWPVVALVIVFVVQFGLIGLWTKRNSRRNADASSVLAMLQAQYGGELTAMYEFHKHGPGWRGTRHDVNLALFFATTGTSKSPERWTFVDVALPENYPLVLNVRRHGWFDGGRIKRGNMVDVQIGEAIFDEALRIEAAPAEIVANLIGPKLQAFLLMHPKATLTTDEHSPIARLAFAEWHDIVESKEAVLAMTQFGRRLAPAYQAADEPIVVDSEGNPYRDQVVDEAPLRAARRARIDEVHQLEAILANRKRAGNIVVMVALSAVVAVIAFAQFAQYLHKHH